jgi:prephenate dehydrogenase
MQARQLSIIGVGFLGASVGLAAKRRGLFSRVLGVDTCPDHLHEAMARGAIDQAGNAADATLATSDVLVVCTPVDTIVEQVRTLGPRLSPGACVTDVGSTKARIVHELNTSAPNVAYVGAHPLAGSEAGGPARADAELFAGRCVILTPTPITPAKTVAAVEAFWQALGARTLHLTPEEHDNALATTSHVPHLVAAALAGTLPSAWRDLVSTGFRDTTRVAAGSPALWTPIFQHNREPVLAALADYLRRLSEFHDALAQHDAPRLAHLLQHGKQVRDALGR